MGRSRRVESGGKHQPADRVCLVWNRRETADGHSVLFHGGATMGFTAFVGFSPTARTAVALLANTRRSLLPRPPALVDTAYLLLRRLMSP